MANGSPPASRSVHMLLALFLSSSAAAFLFFMLIGGQGFLFDTYDHWISGHGMLLSDGYIHAGFRTPLLFPVEDARGPVGAWAPYTGWPPLFFVVLTVWRLAFGLSLASARAFSCLLSAFSAALVAVIAWRSTRTLAGTCLAAITFSVSPIVMDYCSLVFPDVAALAWCLLLIWLYPAFMSRSSLSSAVAYCIAVAVGCLLSWHCFLVPVACAAAHAVVFREDARKRLTKYASAVAVALVVGIILLAQMRYLETRYEPNGWDSFGGRSSVLDKLLVRTGWQHPRTCLSYLIGTANTIVAENCAAVFSLFIVLALAGALQSAFGPVGLPHAEGADTHVRTGSFYVLALFGFAALWMIFMPQFNTHHFQRMFWVPFVGVAAAVLLAPFRSFSRPLFTLSCGVVIMAALVWGAWHVPLRRPVEIFTMLEKDVRILSDSDTLVVMGIDDRGAWWRTDRQVITSSRAKGRREEAPASPSGRPALARRGLPRGDGPRRLQEPVWRIQDLRSPPGRRWPAGHATRTTDATSETHRARLRSSPDGAF